MLQGKRLFQRRAILIYLLAIAAPALTLLFLCLQSVERQRRAYDALLVSNFRLSGEKLAAELERRSMQLAEACLRDLRHLTISHAELEKVRQRHPIAKYFFFFDGDRLKYPLLRTPLPRTLPDLPQPFREAEDQELRMNHLDLALAGYRRSYALAASEPVKALALSRVARCLKKLNRAEEAQLTWQNLLEKYGDLYDPSHRPYGLIARIELDQTAGLYEDIAGGRWQLAADQVEYFLSRVKPASHETTAPFLEQFRFARGLEQNFRHQGPLRPDEVYSYSFSNDGKQQQIFYRLLEQSPGSEMLAGFASNPKWVDEALLPQCRREMGMQAEVRPIWRGDPHPEAPAGGARRDLLLYGAFTALVVAVLVMGVLFLIREVTRETRLNQLRSEFVSSISHELKTPITLIRLYGETLLHGKDFQESERRDFYQIITRESERLSHLVEKVLSFSRIERGEEQYVMEQGDLAGMIAPLVEVYQEYLKRSGFDVKTILAPELPAMRFDPTAVSRAVVNLLDNAVKYSGESKFVGVRLRAEHGKAIFEVEDHGIGIRPEEQGKIFERFYRSPNGSGKGGYGLGLFLVRHIMEAHGGRVELDSEPGRGSRFRLVFPEAV